jgi:structural maintenance of chromosome 1
VIELVSGSYDCRGEYDRLKLEMEGATEQSIANYNKKRGINAEIKAVKERRQEGERWDKLSIQLDRTRTRHALWKLYHLSQTCRELSAEIEQEIKKTEKVKGRQEALEIEYKSARKEHASATKKLLGAEARVKSKEKELMNAKPESARLVEKISHANQKSKTSSASLKLAVKQQDDLETSIDGYENDLEAIEARAVAFEKEADKLNIADTPMLDEAGLQQYSELYVSSFVNLSIIERLSLPNRLPL